MILHKLLLFLIILSRPVRSISINGHRTTLTTTFSKFDLDIIPNTTIRFQISNIHQKALSIRTQRFWFQENPTIISPVISIRSQRSKFANCRGAARSIQAILYIFRRFLFKTYFINRFKFVFKTISTLFQIQIKIEFFNLNSC